MAPGKAPGFRPSRAYHWPVPITPAHAVVAIPLRRLGLPVAAVVVGSMVPDVAVFLPQVFDYDLTHSALGVVTIDLAVGLALLFGWWCWLREPAVDLLPEGARRRVPVVSGLHGRGSWFGPRVVLAIVVGATTHVLWDSFTHESAQTTSWLAALDRHWGPWPGYQWFQVLSGVLGLLLVLRWWRLSWRRAAVVARPPEPRGWRRVSWFVLVGATAVGSALAALLLSLRDDVWWVTVLRVLLRGSVLGAVAGLVVVTVAWQRRHRSR